MPISLARMHADQMPTAAQLVAVQNKLEMAFGVALMRIAFRLPSPAVPDHHRAAAILPLRDRALELVVFDRVILDVHGETLIVRIEAWTTRHGPAFHHAIKLKPQVVVQTRSSVFLDDVGKAAPARLVATRLRRDVEFSLLSVSLERQLPHRLLSARLYGHRYFTARGSDRTAKR